MGTQASGGRSAHFPLSPTSWQRIQVDRSMQKPVSSRVSPSASAIVGPPQRSALSVRLAGTRMLAMMKMQQAAFR
jgi:hypothetical protein